METKHQYTISINVTNKVDWFRVTCEPTDPFLSDGERAESIQAGFKEIPSKDFCRQVEKMVGEWLWKETLTKFEKVLMFSHLLAANEQKESEVQNG